MRQLDLQPLRASAWTHFLLAVVGLFAVPTHAQAAAGGKIRFNEQVRPILSDRCFACHGPDEKNRQAELRLDLRDGAVADLGGHSAVVPGKSAESELLSRISSTDPDAVMPPPTSKKTPLTAAEIAILQQWIDEGAEYQGLWSLQPMTRPAIPELPPNDGHVFESPIDRFIVQKLSELGSKSLSAEAPKERLIRRVTFDLTGLPPTPAEVDAFISDHSPAALERVVDRLLASPRFGERMASEWLDLARFADTQGYQVDRFRPMWPYRDWVIKAFNQNLPFDQFTTWQIAGDLLPNATKEQRLATAFNRLHSQNEEGGIVDEEFRVAYVNDRVTTFGTAFLGLTFECSRCHDHKYDPITQRDFYSLFAFFQNIAEAGQTSYYTTAMPTPTLLLSTDEQDRKIAELSKTIAEREQTLKDVTESATKDFEAWLANRPSEAAVAGCVAHFPFDAIKKGQTSNLINGKKRGREVEGPQICEGKLESAVKLNGENGFTFPNVGDFSRADAFSLSLWVHVPKSLRRGVILHNSKAAADAASRGYDLLWEEGRIAFGLYHFWPGNAIKVQTTTAVATDEWAHLAVTYDGSSRASGVRLYVNGQLAATRVLRDELTKDITYDRDVANLTLGHRFRDSGIAGTAVDDLKFFDRELTAVEAGEVAGRGTLAAVLSVSEDSLTADDRDALKGYYLATACEPWQKALAEFHTARAEYSNYVNPIPEAMVMEELPQPKPAFVLNRGSYDQPTIPVTATTPTALPPLADSQPRSRLGLAQWLVDPEHPLMARVTVNRMWQMMFGRGLVETSDNFGSQGAQPTHPELLDWLSRDFIANGWDLKRMLRQMALSETYRQDSRFAPADLQEDPENRWLARGAIRRLTAEMIRDQALFASGLLHESIGGPSVKPYQPNGIWDIAASEKVYVQDHGEDLYRRSLYSYWRKTLPPPAMVAFDAADRSYCTVKRQSTSTPLQALTLLNDPQIVEASRVAGERMLRAGVDKTEDRAAWIFRLITSRPATDAETAVLVRLFNEQREIFASDEEAAKKLLAVGEAKRDESLAASDAAAATVLALAIFNYDEAAQRR